MLDIFVFLQESLNIMLEDLVPFLEILVLALKTPVLLLHLVDSKAQSVDPKPSAIIQIANNCDQLRQHVVIR